jgi:4-amino-4-deoxy-L-arabinose transferase-like glycosyltransferase
VTRRARRGAGRKDRPTRRRLDAATLRRSLLLLVIVLATLVRSVNLWWMSDHPITEFQTTWTESDMAIHWAWAGRIEDGDVLGRDAVQADTTWMRAIAPAEVWERWQGGHGTFAKAPLYPYVLATLRLAARDRVRGVLVGQMLIGLAGVGLTFVLTDRLFGPTAATVAGLCAAVYGPSLLHETLLVRDCLAATTSLLLLWGLARCTAGSRTSWLVAGLLFSLALLARELTILFGPLVVLWIVQRLRADPTARRAALVSFAAGVSIGLLPLVLRNLAVGVEPWAISALGGHGVVLGHAPEAVPAGFMVPESAKAIFLEAQGRLVPTVRLTLAAYHGDWVRFLYNECARAAAILASFEAGDNASWYYFTNRWPLLRFSLHYHVALALGLVGLWVGRERARDDARILVYFLLAAFAGLQYTTVVARYRLVPAAVLMIYAGVAVDWLLETVRERRWRAAAIGVGATAAAILLSTSLLADFAARNRYRAAEFLIAARGFMERQQPGRAYDEMRAGLLSAYVDPAQRVLPGGYLQLASGLLRVGPTIGRGADAAMVIDHLGRTFDADPGLAALRTAGSLR